MSWEDIAELARDPLVTIGAHTVNHYMLKKTPDRVARSEMEMSRAVIECRDRHPAGTFRLSGRRPDLGRPARIRIAAELGFKTA